MKVFKMNFHRVINLAMYLVPMLFISNAAQAQTPVSSAKVISAIKRGVHYLLSQRNPKTFWEHGIIAPKGTSQYLGESSLVIEALLDVENSLHVPGLYIFKSPMKESIKFLMDHRNNTTYAASFQANALALLPRRKEYEAALHWDANFLYRSIHVGGGYSYAWGTPEDMAHFSSNRKPDGRGLYVRGNPAFAKMYSTTLDSHTDNSNTQYGVLGMWAAVHVGLPIPTSYWINAAKHWRTGQFINGSWGYLGQIRTPSRTAKLPQRMATFTPAGVASLLISDEFLGAHNVSVHPMVDRNVVAGLHWINKNFNPNANDDQYEMYGYERVGLASGLQYFGGHNWYNDYARMLVTHQNAQGFWTGHFFGVSNIIATAYSLLILDRGLNPIFMNKLQYDQQFYGQWNARQRDVANVTSWVSDSSEAPLNWQVVNFNAPVSNWLDSPILMITGHKDPKFNKKQIAELRAYVNAGGMVFCSCDGNSLRFKSAMIKYGQAVVDHKYEFHRMTAKSMLLTIQPWYHMYFNMLVLSNSVRDLWIVSPQDMGAVWERRAFAQKKFWEFPMNLYLYATGKGYLADRLHSLVVPQSSAKPQRTIHIDRLKYNGNWNPEPGAWPRFKRLVLAHAQTQINISTVNADKLIVHHTLLADMTGTGTFAFSTAEVAALRHYLDQGGMLFADAAGGNKKFTNSFGSLVTKLYPQATLNNLPVNSSIYTGSIPGGTDANHVKYRRYYIAMNGIKHTPEFLGVKKAGRWVIVFSPDDITSGFLGTKTWGISGYSPSSAVALATNVVAYAAKHAH